MANLEYARCPECGKIAKGRDKVEELFGVRIQKGKYATIQSWCKVCRNK